VKKSLSGIKTRKFPFNKDLEQNGFSHILGPNLICDILNQNGKDTGKERDGTDHNMDPNLLVRNMVHNTEYSMEHNLLAHIVNEDLNERDRSIENIFHHSKEETKDFQCIKY
jgi:hypothetical protein